MKKNILNIAVIGCNKMGEKHIRGVLEAEHTALYALCDSEPQFVDYCRDLYHPVRAVTDYRELLNDPQLDAVILVVPDNLHMEMSIAFMEAGKDVLCEKPMALTMPECEAMIAAERRTGRKLMVGQVVHYQPAFIQARKMIEEGRIGELYFIESEYAHSYKNVRGWNDWRVTPERNGFIGGGCHAVNLLCWIAGFPEEAFAYSNHKCLTDWPADDCTVALYRFPNNVMGKVMASIGCRRDYTMRSVFYGTTGTIICNPRDGYLTLYETTEGDDKSFTEPKKIPVEFISHNVKGELVEFVEAVLNDTPLPITSLEGAKTVAACRAAVDSAAIGQPVKIVYPE